MKCLTECHHVLVGRAKLGLCKGEGGLEVSCLGGTCTAELLVTPVTFPYVTCLAEVPKHEEGCWQHGQ